MEEDHYPGSWGPPGYGKDQGQSERKSVVATNWQAGRRSYPCMPPVSACQTQSQTCAHQIKPVAWRSLARDLNWPSWDIKWRTPPGRGRLLFLLDRSYTTEENRCQPRSKKLGSIFATHGLPQTIHSDNGLLFVSKEFEGFLEYLGIQHKEGVPYWPQSNGEVERCNETLLKIVRIARLEGKDWWKSLQNFLFQYRVTPHTVTAVSPALLLVGRKLRDKLRQVKILEDRPLSPFGNRSWEREMLVPNCDRKNTQTRRGLPSTAT